MNNLPKLIDLEPMWNIDVGPCFAIKGIDWLPADKMRDISSFLNHALQEEMSKAEHKIDTSNQHVDGVKIKPHPIECDDVYDESGVVVAKGGSTNGR